MRGTQPCPFDCIVKQKQKAKTNKKFHAFIWRTVDLLEINQGVHKRALTEPDTYPDDLKPFSNRQSSCFKARTFFTLEYVCISNPFLYPPVFGVLNCHPGKKILAIVIVSPLCLFFFSGWLSFSISGCIRARYGSKYAMRLRKALQPTSDVASALWETFLFRRANVSKLYPLTANLR